MKISHTRQALACTAVLAVLAGCERPESMPNPKPSKGAPADSLSAKTGKARSSSAGIASLEEEEDARRIYYQDT